MIESDWKDRHQGETCVVIGNGPSLTDEILARLHEAGLFTFGANGLCLAFDRTPFRPSAVCMSNHDAVRTYGDRYPDATWKFYKAGAHAILTRPLANLFELPFPCDHDQGVHRAPFIRDGHFTGNPFRENFCGDTVLLDFAIPLAAYLGFTLIALCGVDCDYTKGYFSPAYEVRARPGFAGMVNEDYSIAIPSYRYAADALALQGRRLVRLTPSERLSFLPALSFDALLERTPS